MSSFLMRFQAHFGSLGKLYLSIHVNSRLRHIGCVDLLSHEFSEIVLQPYFSLGQLEQLQVGECLVLFG